MPRRTHASSPEPTTYALESRLGPYEVTSMTLRALGAWSPHPRPGTTVSMVRRVVSRRGWLLRLMGLATIVLARTAWTATARFERFELTALPVHDPEGRLGSQVFVESSLTGRAGARVAALLAELAQPATEPARRV